VTCQAAPVSRPTWDERGGWAGVLGTLTQGRDLDRETAGAAMGEILEGTSTPAQIAGFIVALRMKGETVDELTGLVGAMLKRVVAVTLDEPDGVIDLVGTGGDRSNSINVSTLAALVVAGAGGRVCKHGNRAASSACGAADLLEALGVAFDLGPEGVARCVAAAGIGFCFAPRYHGAMRHAGPPRRELGVPTVFNVLGPMSNPARVRRQVIGVADEAVADRMVRVLAADGSERALVVHGHDGLDELTTTTTSTVHELRDGDVRRYDIDPAAYGIKRSTLDELRGGDPATNARMARQILDATPGPGADIVTLNAGAGLLVAGLVDDLADGVELAHRALADGRAAQALEDLVRESQAARAEEADQPATELRLNR